MAQALRDAYGDIFLIKENPSNADKTAIEGKFKSFHNVSDNVAGLMAKTFLGLLALADQSGKGTTPSTAKEPEKPDAAGGEKPPPPVFTDGGGLGLHYNIQIHLPPTKDIEVYNAIFKSLREHLLEK